MGKVAGIDLGTTFSAISILNDSGKPEIVKNQEGDYLTPSVVAFPSDQDGLVIVGEMANAHLEVEPDRVIKEVKRDMGTDKTYSLAGNEHTPQGISSMILKKLVQDAEKQVGKIDSAVVTVPANFREQARQSTMKAAEEAGINVEHIIDEPTAAALHYATSNKISGTVMIYDLGGGTFDVTIATIVGKDIKVITSVGSQNTGGTDIDKIILEKIKKHYKEKFNSDLINTNNDRNEFYYTKEAEKIKKALSIKDKYKAPIKGNEGSLFVDFTRDEFENDISTLIADTEGLMEEALDEAKDKGINENDIKNILLVGGSTRIPAVSKLIKKKFNKDPLTGVNVDEAISLGAAIYAGKKADPTSLSATQQEELKKVDLEEVCNAYYGTIILQVNQEKQAYDNVVSIIIEKNTPLPCSKTETYYTIADGQTQVDCEVTQSVAKENNPKFVDRIWKGVLDNLPPNRPSGQEIQVTYGYDENKMMICKYKDVESGKEIIANLNMESKDGSGAGPTADDFTIE